MNKRDVIRMVMEFKRPPYVPWSLSFTHEAKEKLTDYYGPSQFEEAIQEHILYVNDPVGCFSDIGSDCVRDVFGVTWDRSMDKDIGIVKGTVLPQPNLKNYEFPNPLNEHIFGDISSKIDLHQNRFRVFCIGFSLYERAWTLRGMENLLMDFYENPAFVHELLNAIADYNISQVKHALNYDIDAVYFGDDWGQQHGLLMGPEKWREFIKPVLKRMYETVRSSGKFVLIHSCGDVDELFDELYEIGVNCFNPFQPEVMDVEYLMKKYFGQLSFLGGMSTQQTLPYGSLQEVKNECSKLLSLGSNGGYIFSPAHAIEGDVPVENMVEIINIVKQQPGFGY